MSLQSKYDEARDELINAQIDRQESQHVLRKLNVDLTKAQAELDLIGFNCERSVKFAAHLKVDSIKLDIRTALIRNDLTAAKQEAAQLKHEAALDKLLKGFEQE